MSVDPRVTAARTRFPLLADAVERQLGWARDYVIAGDVDSAVDAIRDACAAFAELRAADASATGVCLAYETLEDPDTNA